VTFARPALLVAALTAGGCFGGLAPKTGTVRVRNQTASTPFCRIEVRGQGPDDDHAQSNIAPGQEAALSFKSGPRSAKKTVCVYACAQARGLDGRDTKLVGCGDMNLDPQHPDEVVVYDGPERPQLPPAVEGHRQVVWENNVNPVFTLHKNKRWLTPYGQVRSGAFHATVAHPGGCPRTVILKTEDRKALKNKFSTDPRMTDELATDYPPVYLSFGLDRTERDLDRVWDLPAGVYQFKVRDDCTGLDLIDQKFAEGATDRPKRIGVGRGAR